MRKLLLYVFFLSLFGNFMKAQNLTVEYDLGYGDFCMREYKRLFYDVDKEMIQKNFPGNLIHQVKIGMEMGEMHHFGLSYDRLSTEGRLDFDNMESPSIDITGNRLGVFYRITPKFLTGKKLKPYFMLTAGAVLNEVDMRVLTDIGGNLINNDKGTGTNYFLEPALGFKMKLTRLLTLNVSAGYQADIQRNLEFEGYDTLVKPTWSGLRGGVGLIFYPFK
ncbi:MAG: hypothetical protein LBE91_04705 [Tannerella sp.]|jgi:hypothetical protein|nr:hypothetical protein [Tannerella sp.]